MKKLFSLAVSLLVVSLALPATLFATSTGSSGGYNAPTLYEEFNFTAVQNDQGQVEMSWTPFAPNGFNYYKIVRSTINPNPVYPDDGYIKVSSDKSFSSYADTKVPSGTVYYRVCSISRPDRFCSPVVTIVSADGTEVSENDVHPDALVELNLKAGEAGGKVELTWTLSNPVTNGFKIVRSTKNEYPTYPVMEGDIYYYIENSTVSKYTDAAVKAKTMYYYRVCQYDGNGKCLAYSNTVKITLSDEAPRAEEPKTVEKKESKEALVPTAATASFKDTQENAYINSIEYVREKGFVKGYDDKTYRPDQPINRAEFTKIIISAIYKAAYIDECLKEGTLFSDVDKEAWYAKYICVAKKEKIISGYSDGTFKPAKYINFAEAAKIMTAAFDIAIGAEGKEWYEKYVYALQLKKFIPPSVSVVGKDLNRGEMAEMIWRIKEGKTGQPSRTLVNGGVTVQAEPKTTQPSSNPDWQVFTADGYSFEYPTGWYHGIKRGWDYFSEEKDYIDNLETPNYMDVDSYVLTYKKTVSASMKDEDALRITNTFDHPQIEENFITIGNLSALRRHFRAPEGTEVNGRVTGEDENIFQYTYRNGNDIYVLQYFLAFSNEEYNLDLFEKMAGGLKKN